MIRKKPRRIPYNELFGKSRISYGKVPGPDDEAEINEGE